MTMFIILIIIGAVIYFAMRGRQDRPEQLGASRRALPTGSIEPQSFACPYPKCPTCGASGDKMKQEWDGLRAVKWSCNYCSAVAGVQTLKDEELPTSARRRLGMDSPAQGAMPMQPGGYGQGGGMGGLLTGMMLGSMMGGGHRDHDHSDRGDGWGGGASGGSSSDWGESNSNSGSSDWGESGGGDSGGDSGGDW
jgi:hypothetical protein